MYNPKPERHWVEFELRVVEKSVIEIAYRSGIKGRETTLL